VSDIALRLDIDCGDEARRTEPERMFWQKRFDDFIAELRGERIPGLGRPAYGAVNAIEVNPVRRMP
jgi:hypothetical protein